MVNYLSASDPEARLRKLRLGGRRQKKVNLLIVPRRSPEVMAAFGQHFLVVEEGQGLYSHKFFNAFATITPNHDRFGFWWREIAARCDNGAIIFT